MTHRDNTTNTKWNKTQRRTYTWHIKRGKKQNKKNPHIHTLASPPVPPLRHIYRWFVHRVRRRLVCRHKWTCRTDNTHTESICVINNQTNLSSSQLTSSTGSVKSLVPIRTLRDTINQSKWSTANQSTEKPTITDNLSFFFFFLFCWNQNEQIINQCWLISNRIYWGTDSCFILD